MQLSTATFMFKLFRMDFDAAKDLKHSYPSPVLHLIFS